VHRVYPQNLSPNPLSWVRADEQLRENDTLAAEQRKPARTFATRVGKQLISPGVVIQGTDLPEYRGEKVCVVKA
jgi:hypothetical protein